MHRLALFILAVAFLVVPVRAQSLVACSGGMAAAFPCAAIDLAANLPVSTFNASRGADLWGWTDPQTSKEYALAAFTNGVAFVDVTDPENLVYLGKLPTSGESTTWRDVKVYDNHAFVVADNAGSHGLQVFDLTRLRNVSNPPETFTQDANYNGISSAHNIAINEDTGFAYLVGGDDCGGGLHIVNIQNPTSPAYAGCANDGYTHDVQCVTYTGPDTDYFGAEICMASNGRFDNTDFLSIIDVTDKENPVVISRGFYSNPGYTHQGWFADDQRYFLITDELDEPDISNTRTIIMDVSDLDNPEFHAFYFGPVGSNDHNIYIRGDYAFLSAYSSGLRVLDLSNIDTGVLTEVGNFDTYPADNDSNFNGQWSNYPFFDSGNVVVNDRDNGLFVLTPQFDIVTSNETIELPIEGGFALSTAFPNPFAVAARLSLTVEETQNVFAEAVDINGRRVALLFEGIVSAGSPVPLSLAGDDLPSGVYLVRVLGEHFSATRRVSLVH